ncbi:hypothetical protein [Kitasatospora kifunensis]|uniref:Antibiotic biosynthesis monooxygenase (ABM) superfamily enzyme n=1 Tax=Kitasatospora kifunensis TaxID=58351 RepID=A0A7W7VV78_KITKI|nr:hypothetical protein [Kitasatospora kifunensis]MBB4924121.1 antibiotic biosynthesis monooxygenase (ABM) superfamily enzyme [Kitasatospora kifunensis]
MPALPVHHRAAITWLAVYPTITLVLALIGPHTAHLPLFVRTLILSAIVVPVVVYGLIPALQRVHAATIGRRARYPRKAVV